MSEELARQVARLSSELDKEKREARRNVEIAVPCMLALSYADLVSDIYVAVLLLDTPQARYGITSLCFVSISLATQAGCVRLLVVSAGSRRTCS
jgi:hypothetical protein